MRLHHFIDGGFRLLSALAARPGPASGILLISAGGLGDTVLFALMLRRLRSLAHPGETVTVLLRQDAAKMAFLFPPDIIVRTVDFRRLRQSRYRLGVFMDLWKAHYRLAVSTDYLRHPDLDEALLLAAGAPETAAMLARPSPRHDRRLRAHARRIDRLYDSGSPHRDKMLRWNGFADFLTGRESPPPVVALPEDERPAQWPLPFPTVIFQPFSAVALKQSPPDLWELIIDQLPKDWRIKLAGHPSDLDKNPQFKRLLNLPHVEFEGAPFDRLAGMLRSARMVVSVDTACMHLAVALGTPTLCLASAAYVGEIVPYDPVVTPANVRFLFQPVDCQGCLGSCRFPPEDGMYPCVAALDPDQVIGAVRDMLARGDA